MIKGYVVKKYIRQISELLNANEVITAKEVLEFLVTDLYKKENELSFFSDTQGYKNILVDLLGILNKYKTLVDSNDSDLKAELRILFKLVKNNEISPANDLGKLLTVFLNLYPDYITILDEESAKKLKLTPYFFSPKEEAKNLFQLVGSAEDGTRSDALCVIEAIIPLVKLDYFSVDSWKIKIDKLIAITTSDNYFLNKVFIIINQLLGRVSGDLQQYILIFLITNLQNVDFVIAQSCMEILLINKEKIANTDILASVFNELITRLSCENFEVIINVIDILRDNLAEIPTNLLSPLTDLLDTFIRHPNQDLQKNAARLLSEIEYSQLPHDADAIIQKINQRLDIIDIQKINQCLYVTDIDRMYVTLRMMRLVILKSPEALMAAKMSFINLLVRMIFIDEGLQAFKIKVLGKVAKFIPTGPLSISTEIYKNIVREDQWGKSEYLQEKSHHALMMLSKVLPDEDKVALVNKYMICPEKLVDISGAIPDTLKSTAFTALKNIEDEYNRQLTIVTLITKEEFIITDDIKNEVANTLLDFVENPDNNFAGGDAIKRFANDFPTESLSKLINSLIHFIEYSCNIFARTKAIDAIVVLIPRLPEGISNQFVIDCLINLLSDDNHVVRMHATQALCQLEKYISEEHRNAIINNLNFRLNNVNEQECDNIIALLIGLYPITSVSLRRATISTLLSVNQFTAACNLILREKEFDYRPNLALAFLNLDKADPQLRIELINNMITLYEALSPVRVDKDLKDPLHIENGLRVA
jgi:hypothetical protein